MAITEKMITDSYLKTSRFETDPETRLEVFIKHWLHALTIMSKECPTLDESEPIIYYMEEMVSLLNEEKCNDGANKNGPILQYSLNEDIFNKIYKWSEKCSGDVLEKLKQQQLRLYSSIISQGHPSVLHYREIFQPLLRLLNEYSLRSSHRLELSLVNLLKLISVRVSNEPMLQSLCTEIGLTGLQNPLPLLDPLVPFLYRDGILGQQAKDAVLLLLSLSMDNESVACSVALQSDFCPVLATGLSALYSALPRKLPTFCHSVLLGQLTSSTISKIPGLQNFLQYLNFCCQVNEVTHPLVKEAVLHYIYNGFLLPVIRPSLNQNSLEEVISATIYLDLFLRAITNSEILKTFLCFIVSESHDGFRILSSFINRMNSNSGIGVVTMSLMNTLLSFNCEDVMFELIFKHLICCQHVSPSPRDPVCDNDIFLHFCQFLHELHFDHVEDQWILNSELLETVKDLIEKRSVECQSSWHFDYNGINPSKDYLEKMMDPNFFQTHRPFHGFLDHYSQLLEMRDACRKSNINSRIYCHNSRIPNGTAIYDNNGSFSVAPRTQFSRSYSMETIESIKSELDSQLDKCVQRLRFPSEEDLLEQKSRYIISYSMVNDFGAESVNDSEILHQKVSKRFDKNPTTFSINNQDSVSPTKHGVTMEEIKDLAKCDQIEEFIICLDKMEDVLEDGKWSDLSFDNIIKGLHFDDENKMKTSAGNTNSPFGSVISFQSGLTIEDNILKDHSQSIRTKKISTTDRKEAPTVGQFLCTILTRLESFQTNPFQINLQLTSLIISLLSFPQPLLRNFLLHPFETFTNELKSLYGVLKKVRNEIAESKFRINVSKGSNDFFQNLCFDAKSRLTRRLMLLEEGQFESDEILSLCDYFPNSQSEVALKGRLKNNGTFQFMNFLSRSIRNDFPNSNWLNFNRKSNKEELESCRQLNVAYSAVILDYFFQEIVAFSKEYSVHMQF